MAAPKVVRLQNTKTGVVVETSEENAGRLAGYEPVSGSSKSDGGAYSGLKVDELKAEIDRRNEGRDDADLLSTEGKKADLIAALESDDGSK